jgi:DNA polymerase I-like protein with 3'-5' exonuclease and polymerase domains
MVQAVLVDRRNFDLLAPKILAEIQASPSHLTGFDIESQDDLRHEGLNALMKIDPVTRKKSTATSLVFDHRATVVTGFSLYPDEADNAYYINLAHADVENRLPWAEARTLLDEIKKTDGYFVAHNAPYELRIMGEALDYEIEKIICSLQMAVSAYGPDDYDLRRFAAAGLGGIDKVMVRGIKAFRTYDKRVQGSMTPEQADVFKQIVGKESRAEWSYNGLVKSVTYGYGLKEAVKSWFDYQMTTFKEVLGDKAHMGQLTGDEVAAYGADDAVWAVKLYHRLMAFMLETNPPVVKTFFTQENPMTHIYSDVARQGMRVNLPAIEKRRTMERAETANVIRELKAAVRSLLPFSDVPNETLAKHESWYAKGYASYRSRITRWATQFDCKDDFAQVHQISGAVSESWAVEKGLGKSSGPNLSHYMMGRTLIYDLMGENLVMDKGKVQSDANARGRVQDRIEKSGKTAGLDVLKGLAALAGIEQRMKLYLTPYMRLTDPETQRMYPVLSSMLASRRMACQNPNGMQLAKRGESTYVRGFYLPDNDDHVILSMDWSGVELVMIGDQSGDPEFKKAFGQIPYEDLHAGAAADVLAVEVEALNEELFGKLKGMPFEVIQEMGSRLVTNLKGETMTDGAKIAKYWRTEIGKGSNFEFWYSGALSTVAKKMGWTSDQMWAATDKYRERFAVAEAWRKRIIEEAQRDGFTMLPDGHRRVRTECTALWQDIMFKKFSRYEDVGCDNLAREVIRSIKARANNQIVNSRIQGSCATLAKRSIIRIDKEIKARGWDARFMLPIHDELLYSVHKDQVIEFSKMQYKAMCENHKDIVPNLPLHATAAVGLTFEPFSKSAPLGQIEFDEAPDVDWLPKSSWGGPLDDTGKQAVLDYLFSTRDQMKIAA